MGAFMSWSTAFTAAFCAIELAQTYEYCWKVAMESITACGPDSVIVPTLNEAETLAATLEAVPRGAELIVSDGGSTDETVAIAARHGARVVTGERGRALQLNCGAQAAAGDVLVFIHADCVLGPDARDEIMLALQDSETVGGAFSLRIRNASRGLKLIAAASNFRARHLGTPYGDQGLFVRRNAFDQVSGYPELPFMEDVAIVRKLRKMGKLVHSAFSGLPRKHFTTVDID